MATPLLLLIKATRPAILAVLACFILITTAWAQVGLTQQQVRDDITQTMSEATASMLSVEEFKILSSEEVSKGKFQIDVEIGVQADEQAMQRAIARARANKLNSNWRQETQRMEQLAASSRKKSGTTETIRAIYELDQFGSWSITEVSDTTSEYTRLRNQGEQNSAPEEAQIVAEFESMVDLISNGAASISGFNIYSADALPKNKVKLKIRMTFKGNGGTKQNVEFARRIDGVLSNVEVIYQRDTRGNWRRVAE